MISDMALYKRCWHPLPNLEKVGEWKRAYSIHEFFMENCKEPYFKKELSVSVAIIQKLREFCIIVLAHRNQEDFKQMADKYLPNVYQDYGEAFKLSLIHTIKLIDEIKITQQDRLFYKEGE